MGGRIALFVPSLQGGGAERVMLLLAQAFAKRGLAVDLVLAKASGPYLEQVPPEVRLVDLSASRILAGLSALIRHLPIKSLKAHDVDAVLTVLPALLCYILREKPAVMLSALEHANFLALWAKKISLSSTRVYVSEHNTLRHIAQGKTSRDKIGLCLIKLIYPWAEAVVAVSQGVAADLVSIGKLPSKKIRVVYNPVPIQEISDKAREPVSFSWFAPNEQPVILAAGRLTAAKDFWTLIRAFAILRRERPFRLLILGEGEERFSLGKLVQDLGLDGDVDMPGFVDNPYAYMSRAAVFVLSSAWEGFGNVLVEAMACGCPVVSTDCPGGPAEILENGRYGPLVPVGDSAALSNAILAVLEKPPSADFLRQRSMDFDLDKLTDQYLDVICKTV